MDKELKCPKWGINNESKADLITKNGIANLLGFVRIAIKDKHQKSSEESALCHLSIAFYMPLRLWLKFWIMVYYVYLMCCCINYYSPENKKDFVTYYGYSGKKTTYSYYRIIYCIATLPNNTCNKNRFNKICAFSFCVVVLFLFDLLYKLFVCCTVSFMVFCIMLCIRVI